MAVAAFVRLLRQQSDHGRTPIQSLKIVGHSSRSAHAIGGVPTGCPAVGAAEQFHLYDLLGLASSPNNSASAYGQWQSDLTRARNYELPPVCWFRTDAVVRLIGCETNVFAKQLARHILVKGGVAWGTNTLTWAYPAGQNEGNVIWEFGWGRIGNKAAPELGKRRSEGDYYRMLKPDSPAAPIQRLWIGYDYRGRGQPAPP